MAPEHPQSTPAQPPVVLILSFPSLASFLSSSTHLPTVHSHALKADTLTVVVKTLSNEPSPWSPAPSNESSSSSSSASPPRSSRPAPSPVQLWLPLEAAIAQVYSAASTAFLKTGRITAQVDVVLDSMRGLPFCPPNSAEVVRWQHEGENAEASGESEVDGVNGEAGKGIYDVAALGGTFDHLHAGHKILLTMACAITSRKLIVGISDDVLLKNKKFAHLLEPLQQRVRTVERFVELVRPSIVHDVVPIRDVYGPTGWDPEIEALVVSDETRAGGDTINTLRKEKHLNPLDVHVINLVADDSSSDGNAGAADGAVPAVKVEAAAKMGSTGIREWLDRRERERRERGAEAGDGEEKRNGS
ncbi:hypothetical protein JCM10207_004810 [Rhodosporidiobolus poonsookiae]